ncbi:MAG: collagen binding domain-containing protein, partial [Planctomycetaceae bacterium]
MNGVTVTLTGTDFLGQTVSLVTTTGTDGTYLFSDLMPGTYTVTESQPAEYLDGLDSAGSHGGQVNNDVVSAINLPEGVDATGYNFAEIGPSSLCGTVYVDTDNDGEIDAAETGLLGVIITLVGTDDLGQAVSASTTTDANGHYHFDGLRPGSYTLSQTQPSGYLDGKDSVGEAGGTVGNDSFTITLEACTDACEYNFGELLSSSLAGRVFKECDNDGVFNGLNVGLVGVTVTLTGIDDLGQSVSVSTTTDLDGRYSFLNLRPGIYAVTETQPADYLDGIDTAGSAGGSVANDAISSISLGSEIDATGYDFAELGPSSLCGTVYVDLNNNGALDGDEALLAGVVIALTGTDDRGQSVSLAAITDENGHYEFEGLRPGTYTLTQTQPSGYLDGQDSLGEAGGTLGSDSFTVTLDACTHACDYNFGELPPSSLAGRVFKECDNDGVFNGQNQPLSGVTVTLTGEDDLGNAVSLTATTDTNGRYRFLNLRPGTYTVTESQPATYLDGIDTVGSAGGSLANDEISAISLGIGVDATDYDFAEIGPSSICGTVYVDANDDGVHDADESGLAGVLITLVGTDDRGQSVSLTATTDTNGHYHFEGLRPGTYSVFETQPNGYVDGKETVGTAGGTVGADSFTITLGACTDSCDYNFGELSVGDMLAVGDTATIGFWANKNGQAILRNLNGGASSTLLAQWLVTNFPNLNGASAGSRSLLTSSGAYQTNDQVATTYINAFFKPKATVKLEAQILAAAFATYVTNSSLAGSSNIATRYGFNVSATGTGGKLFSVGSSGAALGVADGT